MLSIFRGRGPEEKDPKPVSRPARVKIYARASDHELIAVVDEEGKQLDWDYDVVVDSAQSVRIKDGKSSKEKSSAHRKLHGDLCLSTPGCLEQIRQMRKAHPDIEVFQVGPHLDVHAPVVPTSTVYAVPSSTVTHYENILVDTHMFRVNILCELSCSRQEFSLNDCFFRKKQRVDFASRLPRAQDESSPGVIDTEEERERLRPYCCGNPSTDPLLRTFDEKDAREAGDLDPCSAYTFGIYKTTAAQQGPRWAAYFSYELPVCTREQIWYWFATASHPYSSAEAEKIVRRAENLARARGMRWFQRLCREYDVCATAPHVQVEGTVRSFEEKTHVYTRGTVCVCDDNSGLFSFQPSLRRGGACILQWMTNNSSGSQVASTLHGWPCRFPEGTTKEVHAGVISRYRQLVRDPVPIVWDAVPHLFARYKPHI